MIVSQGIMLRLVSAFTKNLENNTSSIGKPQQIGSVLRFRETVLCLVSPLEYCTVAALSGTLPSSRSITDLRFLFLFAIKVKSRFLLYLLMKLI